MSNINVMRKNLGPVTAYKYAVQQGYTGTEQEFAALMASYATVAEEAESAKDDAVDAKTAAEAAQQAAEAAQAAAEAAAEQAEGAIEVDETLSVRGRAADAKITGDKISLLKSDLDGTDNELLSYEYTPSSIVWEQGSMYSSSGTNLNSTTRLRTVNRFSRPASTTGIKAAAGYKYIIYVYDPNQSELNGYVGVLQPGGVYAKSNFEWMTGVTFFAGIPAEYTFRVVIAKTDDGTITAADYTGCLIAVSKFIPVENDIANVYKTGSTTPIIDNLLIKTKNVFNSFMINSGSFSFAVGISNISNYTDYATSSAVSKNTPPVRIRDFNGELIYNNLRLNLDKENKSTTCMWLFDKNGYYLRAVTHSQFYHRTGAVNYFKADEYFAIFNLFPGVSGYEDYAWIVDNVNIEWLNATPEYHVGADKEFTTFNGMLTALADDPREKIVYIDPGEYDIFEEYGGTEYMASLADTAASMNWRDVCKVVPPNTHIIGLGSVTLKWIATAEEMQNGNVTTLFSPLNVSGNCIIENIKVIGQNCRYAVHDETSGLARYDGAIHRYKNCYFECLESTYGATTPYGSGHNKNMTLIFDDCEFVNYQNNAWATHHQVATAIEKATIIFNHCIFRRSKTGSDFYVQFTTDKTNGLKDEVRFNGCYIAAKIKFYTASASEVQQGYDITLIGSSHVDVVYSTNVTTRYEVRQLNAMM